MYRQVAVPSSAPPWHSGSFGGSGSGTAYTPVTTHRTLGAPSEAMAYDAHSSRRHATQKEPSKPRKEFPPALREYVQRSFAIDVQIPGITREEVERTLKKIINDAAEQDQLHMISWEVFPLPQQMIQMQRAQSLGVAVQAPPAGNHSPVNNVSSDLAATNISNVSPPNRKRKPDNMVQDEAEGDNIPPWRRNAPRKGLEDRLSFPTPPQNDRMDKRLRRFQDTSNDKSNEDKRKQRFGANSSPWSSREESPEASKGPVVGTCQNLEKKYFRLTSAPKPETVRPLPVLEATLTHLISKWKHEHNYNFICDQFKSLRQDLTVQHVRTSFTVKVYEIHARIALEQGDLGEYNQCQTQLRALYSQKLGGNPGEFLAYRILYLIHTCNRSDMNDVLADLTETDKSDTSIKYALDVRSALAVGNYHKFFKLYLDAPGMSAYLMDKFIDRERLGALANICKAYKPDVPLRFITEELGFESDHQCAQFIVDQNGGDLLQEKDDSVRFLSGKAANLFENAKSAAFKKVDIKGQI